MEGLQMQIYVSRNEGNEMAKMKVEAVMTEVIYEVLVLMISERKLFFTWSSIFRVSEPATTQ